MRTFDLEIFLTMNPIFTLQKNQGVEHFRIYLPNHCNFPKMSHRECSHITASQLENASGWVEKVSCFNPIQQVSTLAKHNSC